MSDEYARTDVEEFQDGFSAVRETMGALLPTMVANWRREERRRITESPVSNAEIRLLEALHRVGLRPEQQVPIGPYDMDFYFPDEKVCVEVDGKQHLEPEQRERDQRRDEYLREHGIATLRISASAIYRDVLMEVKTITLVLVGARDGWNAVLTTLIEEGNPHVAEQVLRGYRWLKTRTKEELEAEIARREGEIAA
jgi:very-short-patch-repair endonuclease